MDIKGLLPIQDFLRNNAAARKPFERWLGIARAGNWTDIVDMRASWPTSDVIKGTDLTCFNVGGNKYRLLARVSYQRREIVIHQLLTHEQYSKKYTR
jgi:mRNA interferase HigB